MRTMIIAEAGVNHDGRIDKAIEMINSAVEAGADCIKFQTFKAESLVTKNAVTADYQAINSGDSNQYDMLKRLELNFESHQTLFQICHAKNIEFLSSPFDLESVTMLDELGVKRFKIASGEITNLPLLKAIAMTAKPIILSTGMSTLIEIQQALDVLYQYGCTENLISLLHANSEYPTPMQDVNLNAMVAMGEHFNLPFGYSDHTLGYEVDIAAVAMGATIIEKHFTLDKAAAGPDHKASLNPQELTTMIKSIRNVEIALGSKIKQPSPSESKNMVIVRKSIVAKCEIKKGETFSLNNLCTKRPGTGLSPMLWHEVLGRVSKRDYAEDENIEL